MFTPRQPRRSASPSEAEEEIEDPVGDFNNSHDGIQLLGDREIRLLARSDGRKAEDRRALRTISVSPTKQAAESSTTRKRPQDERNTAHGFSTSTLARDRRPSWTDIDVPQVKGKSTVQSSITQFATHVIGDYCTLDQKGLEVRKYLRLSLLEVFRDKCAIKAENEEPLYIPFRVMSDVKVGPMVRTLAYSSQS